MKAVVAALNQEKALVGAFSVIVQLQQHYPEPEPLERLDSMCDRADWAGLGQAGLNLFYQMENNSRQD